MVAVKDNILGVGLYSVEDVALYARVSRNLVKRWFFGSKEGEAAVTPRLVGEGKFVPFLEFVQIMAIREIRQAHKEVNLKIIRDLLKIAEEEQGIQYPFARKGITFLWGNELGLKLPDGTLLEASGRHRRNRLLKPVVMLCKEDLGYDEAGLANLFTAYRWNGCHIAMNPHVRFGEPLVQTCGYSAETLWEAAQAEGSMDAAAKAYGVERRDVEAACRYFDHLRGNEAA